MRRGVLIAESVHPNKTHIGGRGINMLTGAEAVAPVGGAAFHDNKVWVEEGGRCRDSDALESSPTSLRRRFSNSTVRHGLAIARPAQLALRDELILW